MLDRRKLLAIVLAIGTLPVSPALAQYPGYPNDERSPRRRRYVGRRRALTARDRMLIEREEVPSSYGTPPSPWN